MQEFLFANPAIVSLIITSLVGVVTSLFAYWQSKIADRKGEAEFQLKSFNDVVAGLQTDNAALRRHNTQLEARILALINK